MKQAERDVGLEQMLREIEREFEYTGHLTGQPHLSPRVRAAMQAVPRDRFVPDHLLAEAYANQPLPIGHGQTISQPYIVALMTQCLALLNKDRVLEIGTGSGYQAAVLSRLADSVYSLEAIPELAKQARQRFQALGLDNIHSRIGNGYLGWAEAAPFDAIMVTAAAPALPPALIEQLTPGGRLIAPVGGPFSQTLVLLQKSTTGRIERRELLPVAFVPLVDAGPDVPA